MNPTHMSAESRTQAIRRTARPRNFQRSQDPHDVSFPIVLRGYDRVAVDEYLEQIGRVISELQATRSTQAAVRQALDRVGEETSAILQQAHATAEQITSAARAQARECVETADREAATLRASAERQSRALAGDTEALWQERTSMVADMRRLAESLLEVADTATERIPKSPADAIRAAARPAEPAASSEPEPPMAQTEPVDEREQSAASVEPPVVDEVPFAAEEDDAPHAWRPLGGGARDEADGAVDRPTEQFDALAYEEPDLADGSAHRADFRR